MPLTLRKLHPLFGAEVLGVDATKAVPDPLFAEIRAAFEEHSVLLFREQPMDDAAQIAFSRRFGPLETAIKANPAGGSPFARQSNVDMETGEIIPSGDRRMIYQLANQMWHTDSSFKPVPSLCSLLSGREVPPEGGATEFATTRAAWDELPEETKRRVEGLVAVHSIVYSRSLVDPTVLTDEHKAEVPPARQAAVRTNPVNGRKALFVGAHASHIEGMPVAEGRALLSELLAFATQPRFCFAHHWRQGDLVVWDNRCVLHRATPYDSTRYRRLMQRTTVAGDAPSA